MAGAGDEDIYCGEIPVSRDAAALVDVAGRIPHLHAFRGFAITNIVLVHAFGSVLKHSLPHAAPDPSTRWTLVLNEVLFHDSTIYFALISGLLFSIALRRRGWPRFFRNKMTNVIAPYAVMTLLFTAIACLPGHGISGSGGTPADLFVVYLSNLFHGTAQSSYWYIPVIAALFVASPLLASLVTGRFAAIGVIVMAAMPLFLSRTGVEVTCGTIAYFAGVYAVGMYLGEGYAGNLARLLRWRWALGAVAASSTAVLVFLFARDLDMVGRISMRESVFYLQKLSVSGLLLCSMRKWENRLPRALDHLASHAFTIYFIHLFLVKVFIHYLRPLLASPCDGGRVVSLSLLLSGATLASSWLISRVVQETFGRHSRWLTGT